MKNIFFLLLCITTLTTFAQSTHSDSVLIKTKTQELKKILSQADTLRPDDIYGDNGIDINSQISSKLIEILSIPSIVNYSPDTLLKHDFLDITVSKDKRLTIFNWYENTGGSFKSNLTLVYYKTSDNKPKAVYYHTEKDTTSSFCSEGAWFTKIIKLTSAKNIYVCLGSIVGCNTCCAEIASVIELTSDNIIFDYPAFTNLKADDHSAAKDSAPCFILDSRCGDIQKFEYNSKTRSINYSYTTDDNTPININDTGKSKLINGKLKWNGKTFIETIAK